MAKPSVIDELQERPDGLTAFESRVVNILALMLIQERKQNDQIDLLNRASFRPAEIAALIGTTPNTVSVQLSVQKRLKKKPKAKKPKK